MKVAETIAKQIGRGALFMIGAKNLVGGENFLMMKIMKNSNRVTHIKIILTSMDDYTMEFYRCWGTNIKKLNVVEGVYFDQLKPIIESETGLYTKL